MNRKENCTPLKFLICFFYLTITCLISCNSFFDKDIKPTCVSYGSTRLTEIINNIHETEKNPQKVSKMQSVLLEVGKNHQIELCMNKLELSPLLKAAIEDEDTQDLPVKGFICNDLKNTKFMGVINDELITGNIFYKDRMFSLLTKKNAIDSHSKELSSQMEECPDGFPIITQIENFQDIISNNKFFGEPLTEEIDDENYDDINEQETPTDENSNKSSESETKSSNNSDSTIFTNTEDIAEHTKESTKNETFKEQSRQSSKESTKKQEADDNKPKIYCTHVVYVHHSYAERFSSKASVIVSVASMLEMNNDILAKSIKFPTGTPSILYDLIDVKFINDRNWQADHLDDSNTLLSSFNREFKDPNICSKTLLVGVNWDGVLGRAYVGNSGNSGICRRNNGIVMTSMVSGQYFPIDTQVFTMVHEFGHNLGSPHDPTDDCEGSCKFKDRKDECAPNILEGGKFIMHPTVNSGAFKNNHLFSPCSKESINTVMGFSQTRSCLNAVPNLVCGNGIIQGNEQCDDDSVCCNKKGTPKECQLADNAICSISQGSCCSEANCNLLESGHVCSKEDECNYSSSCNGLEAKCPKPAPKARGTLCGDGRASCDGNGICNLSPCYSLSLEPCECPFKDSQCRACCFNSSANKCLAYGNSSSKNVKLIKGSPCNKGKGICDDLGECIILKPDDPLSNLLEILLSGDLKRTLMEFLNNNKIIISVSISGVLIVLLILTCILKTNKKDYFLNKIKKLEKEEAMRSRTSNPVNIERNKNAPNDGNSGLRIQETSILNSGYQIDPNSQYAFDSRPPSSNHVPHYQQPYQQQPYQQYLVDANGFLVLAPNNINYPQYPNNAQLSTSVASQVPSVIIIDRDMANNADGRITSTPMVNNPKLAISNGRKGSNIQLAALPVNVDRRDRSMSSENVTKNTEYRNERNQNIHKEKKNHHKNKKRHESTDNPKNMPMINDKKTKDTSNKNLKNINSQNTSDSSNYQNNRDENQKLRNDHRKDEREKSENSHSREIKNHRIADTKVQPVKHDPVHTDSDILSIDESIESTNQIVSSENTAQTVLVELTSHTALDRETRIDSEFSHISASSTSITNSNEPSSSSTNSSTT